jgi:hypothetical protein
VRREKKTFAPAPENFGRRWRRGGKQKSEAGAFQPQVRTWGSRVRAEARAKWGNFRAFFENFSPPRRAAARPAAAAGAWRGGKIIAATRKFNRRIVRDCAEKNVVDEKIIDSVSCDNYS